MVFFKFFSHYTSSLFISNNDATTCNSLASDAVTFNISFSSNIKGSVNNCSVVLEAIDLTLNKLNTALAALVNVTVIVAALPASFDINKDFTIALELLGVVYKVVALL